MTLNSLETTNFCKNSFILFSFFCLHKFLFFNFFLFLELFLDEPAMVRPRIRGTQVLSSVRMKETQESSKWLFLGNLIPKMESKAPN